MGNVRLDQQVILDRKADWPDKERYLVSLCGLPGVAFALRAPESLGRAPSVVQGPIL